MERIPCGFCGLPVKVRQIEPGRVYYCCSGCALVSRLPQPGERGEFPVTPALVVALGVGFAFFNEVLFWTLGLTLDDDRRVAQALLFARVSAGLGAVVWATLVAVMVRAASRHWTDALAAVAALAGLIGGAVSARPAGWLAGVNIALGLWLARGWGKKKISTK